jgi:hypothetical protein
MTNKKDTDRRLLQVSLKPDLYEQVREHCNQLDMPMAIWARELIKRELNQALPPEKNDLLALARAATQSNVQHDPSALACGWALLRPAGEYAEPAP